MKLPKIELYKAYNNRLWGVEIWKRYLDYPLTIIFGAGPVQVSVVFE